MWWCSWSRLHGQGYEGADDIYDYNDDAEESNDDEHDYDEYGLRLFTIHYVTLKRAEI